MLALLQGPCSHHCSGLVSFVSFLSLNLRLEPPWVSLCPPCHTACFILSMVFTKGLLWAKWQRPCHPLTDLMLFCLELGVWPNAESSVPLGREYLPHVWSRMLLYLGLPVGTVCPNCVLLLVYSTRAPCSPLRLELLQLQLQLNQFLGPCSVPGGQSLPFLSVTQSHRPILLQYLIMPRRIQTQGILLFIPPAPSQRVVYSLDIPSFGFLSHLQFHCSRLLLHDATSSRPQNFSCIFGSCLCSLTPFYCKQ